MSSLNLLYRLLDYQRNPNAELFVHVFSSCNLSLIKSLNLDWHLELHKQSKTSSMAIIQAFLTNQASGYTVKDILVKPENRSIYERYVNGR